MKILKIIDRNTGTRAFAIWKCGVGRNDFEVPKNRSGTAGMQRVLAFFKIPNTPHKARSKTIWMTITVPSLLYSRSCPSSAFISMKTPNKQIPVMRLAADRHLGV
jgi:hypothetical protein